MHTEADGGALCGVQPLVEFLGILVQIPRRFPHRGRHGRYPLPQRCHTVLVTPPLLRSQEILEHGRHAFDLGIQLSEEPLLQKKYMIFRYPRLLGGHITD